MKQRVFNLIILDESGSMSSIEKQAIDGVNETVQTIRAAQKKHEDQVHYLTLVSFNSDSVKTIYENVEADIEMKIYHRIFSECGPRRKNEDYIAIREMPDQGRSVFVLCDGMGGHHLGEVASKLVAEHICDYWTKNPKRKDSEKKIIDACNETMNAYNNKSRVEMGTTMAMAPIEGNKALLAHCGDSRIYVVRNHEIIYQSTDHVALTPEGWPIITQAFFTGRNNYAPDIKEVEVEIGDMIFICSDGVYGNGRWNDVKDALLDGDTPDSLDKIKEITGRNAYDNYSAILIHLQF